ncbi:MAG: hypothetical protein C4617_05220 [Candidatus Liberibacter europaeus]|uniref:Uncharacterized protein n=1 Tax=Candidatus Liberibacter europaeus TaxID=744859 RepID=A0A2T4VWK8_9HYPH|nr:hypothetical protein [Candidatus Liberibacter europaeus]PTL86168.1 MAG: hypothetical protein C4617_05220 [Candidatus Liberibacter europaeus]
MFSVEYFLLGIDRLKKCNKGSFVIIFVVLFCSFYTIGDTIIDIVNIIKTRDNLSEICTRSMYGLIPNVLQNLSEKDKIEEVKKQLRYNFITYYPSMSTDEINYTVNGSIISFEDARLSSRSISFRVKVSMEKKVKIESFIFNVFGKSDKTFNVSVHKTALFQKYDFALITIPFTWGIDNESKEFSQEILKFFRPSPAEVKILHRPLIIQKRDLFLDKFFQLIPSERLCVAPYHYQNIIFWNQGVFTYIGGSTSSTSITLQKLRDTKTRNYRTVWDNAPYNRIKKVLQFDNKLADYMYLQEDSAFKCFIGVNLLQAKYMLMIALGNQLTAYNSHTRLGKLCDDIKRSNFRKRDLVTIFSLGIMPDVATRQLLRRCASTESKYFEINEIRQPILVAQSLSKEFTKDWNQRFHVLVES